MASKSEDKKLEEENEDKPEQPATPSDPLTFKRGDYMVHIYLEECRALLADKSE